MKARIINRYSINDLSYEVGDIINVIEFKDFSCSYGIVQDDEVNIINWIPKEYVKKVDEEI